MENRYLLSKTLFSLLFSLFFILPVAVLRNIFLMRRQISCSRLLSLRRKTAQEQRWAMIPLTERWMFCGNMVMPSGSSDLPVVRMCVSRQKREPFRATVKAQFLRLLRPLLKENWPAIIPISRVRHLYREVYCSLPCRQPNRMTQTRPALFGPILLLIWWREKSAKKYALSHWRSLSKPGR